MGSQRYPVLVIWRVEGWTVVAVEGLQDGLCDLSIAYCIQETHEIFVLLAVDVAQLYVDEIRLLQGQRGEEIRRLVELLQQGPFLVGRYGCIEQEDVIDGTIDPIDKDLRLLFNE